MRPLPVIKEFYIDGDDRERSHVLLHITEPSTPAEKEKGYFFALAEVEQGDTTAIEEMQHIIDDLESTYYSYDDEKKSRFETAIELVNRRSHRLLADNAFIHCVVGVLRGSDISLASHGRPSQTLYFNTKHGFDTMDLHEDTNTQSEQLFGSLTEGTISPGDYMCLLTPHVGQFVRSAHIKKMLQEQGLQATVRYIQGILESTNTSFSFGGMIVSVPKDGASRISPSVTDEDEEEDSEGEDEVSEKKEMSSSERIETNERPRIPEESMINTILTSIGKGFILGIVGLFRLFTRILIGIWKLFVGIILVISNRGGQRDVVLRHFQEYTSRKKAIFGELPMVTKLLLFLTVIFFIVFSGSIAYMRIHEKRQAENQAYTNLWRAITDKRNAAEASLIYKDEQKTFNLLQEAKNMLLTLSPKTADDATRKEREFQEIEDRLMVLRKMQVVIPTIVFDVKKINPEAAPERLAMIQDTLLAYGPVEPRLYSLQTLTNEAKQIDIDATFHLNGSDTPKEQNTIVFINGTNGIAEFSKESSSVMTKSISFGTASTSLSSIFVYNQRLYALDTTNNQVFRHNKTQTGYDKGTPWIKTKDTQIRDGISIAIDGDMFLLHANGIIDKFAAGDKMEFTIQGLEPLLSQPIALWTYNGVDQLYILEPTNKRLVVLDKNGKLIQQYTAKEWQHPTAMLIRPEKKQAYVLDDNKVYRIDLK